MIKLVKYYSQWGSLIFLISLFSCKKNITISLQRTPKLVLHGYVAVGEPFTVTIARPVDPAVPDSLLKLNSAVVTLYENGVFKDTLQFDPQQKIYRSRFAIAEYGKMYTIRASADGYPTAEAMAAAPQPVPTIAIDHKKNARLTDYGEYLDDVQFSIQDPAGIKNYYIAALYPPKHFTSSLLCVYSADPAIDRPQADALPASANTCINAEGILFNDQSFNGSLKQITISARSKALQSINDNSGFVHKPYLKRYTVDQAFYKYFKYIASQDADIAIPYFTVPPTDIGNVTNGYGLFTVFSVTTDSIP